MAWLPETPISSRVYDPGIYWLSISIKKFFNIKRYVDTYFAQENMSNKIFNCYRTEIEFRTALWIYEHALFILLRASASSTAH